MRRAELLGELARLDFDAAGASLAWSAALEGT
jgi:hypothetical protein